MQWRGLGHSPREHQAHRWAFWLVAVFFLLWTLAWLWPWPLHLAGTIPRSHHFWDARLNTWILGEVHHNLSHPAAGLFDARIHHPHASLLGYSENLLTLGALTLPFGHLGPLLLHNIVVVLGFAATGLATYAWLARTHGRPAALVAAFLFAYAPFRLAMVAKVQLDAAMLVPLLLLTLERALSRPSLRRWLLAAAIWVAQLGVCLYYSLQLVLLVAPVVLIAVAVRRECRTGRALLCLGLVAACTLAATLFVLAPHVRVKENLGLKRPKHTIENTSGRLEYLKTTTPLMTRWKDLAWDASERSVREPVAFPGATLVVLALLGGLLGVHQWSRRTSARRTAAFRFGAGVQLFWLVGAGVLFLGTGPDAPGGARDGVYAHLMMVVPPLEALRFSNRFVLMGMLALAWFAAAGLNGLAATVQHWRFGTLPLVAGTVLAVGAVELWADPIPLERSQPTEAAYGHLTGDPEAQALLELPFGIKDRDRISRNLATQVHGLPLVGGYTGFDPRLTTLLEHRLGGFPDDTSMLLLKELGVNRVMIHLHEMGRGRGRGLKNRARAAPWLRTLFVSRNHAIYALRDVPAGRAAALRSAVAAFEPVVRPQGKLVPRSAIRFSEGRNPSEHGRMLDGDPDTRWSTGRPQRAGTLWFELTLDRPRTLAAVWYDTRKNPWDTPGGLELRGQTADGRWTTLFHESPYLPLAPLAAAPARTLLRIDCEPTPILKLRWYQLESSRRLWGTVQEIWLQER